jgi:hypothetical protein
MKWICVELDCDRDPLPTDRPLGISGSFLTGSYSQTDVKEFPSAEAARAAGELASNRRAGCTLWVPGERKIAA